MGFFRKAFNKTREAAVGTAKKTIALTELTGEGLGKIATLDLKGVGDKLGKAADLVGLGPGALQDPAILDLSTPDASLVEEQNKKKLLAASRLNSPGIRSQSVLNLR